MASSDSRVLLLTGDAGIGKSAIAANLTVFPETKSIHFCSRSNAKSCRPVAWVQALIFQLALQFPPYQKILDQITAPNWNEPAESLFREFVSDRLAACKDQLHVEGPLVFVIDALDEAEPEMVTFLLETIERIPPWICLVLTSRPDNEIMTLFPDAGATHRHVCADEVMNRVDVNDYLQSQYHSFVQKGILAGKPDLLKRVEEFSNGNFLYAAVIMGAIGDEDPAQRLTPVDIGALHKDLKKLYDLMFRRRFSLLEVYKCEVRPLLDCLVAAPAPVPESLMIAAAGISKPDAYSGLRALSQFLILDSNGYRLFHKSVEEWLTSEPGRNRFAAYPDEGHRHLADAGLIEVSDEKKEISSYTLRWLPVHLIKIRRTNEIASLLSDPRYIVPLWEMSSERTREIWAMIESATPIRMTTTYASVINNPSSFSLKYVELISHLLNYSGHPAETLILMKFLEEHIRAAGDLDKIAQCLESQALIHINFGNKDDAMVLLKQQEQLCRDFNNKDGLQSTLGHQAVLHKSWGDLNQAMILLKEQECLCREIGNKQGLHISLGNQAVICKSRGDIDQAMELAQKQEQLCRELGDKDAIITTLGIQASVYRARCDPDKAMELLKEQEQLCREVGDKKGLQESLGNQASIRLLWWDFEEARELAEEQERLCRELNNKDGLQSALANQVQISFIYDKDGGARALGILNDQEQLCRDLKDKKGIANCLCHRANILMNTQEKLVEAISLVEEACELVEECEEKNLSQGYRIFLEDLRFRYEHKTKKK